jgi:hypothetical protein
MRDLIPQDNGSDDTYITIGRPIVLFDFSGGSISLISSHQSSGMLFMVCFFLL